eukprot:gene7689-8496_t
MEMLGFKSGYQEVPSVAQEINDVEKSDDFQKELDGGGGDLSKSSANRGVLLVAATLFLALSGLALYSTSALGRMNPLLSATSGGGEFDDQQRFILRDFDKAKPMASFLNGLGGLWGVPMWAFYVNRGQGISSFGRQNKDSAIAKFVTAEKAYQQTPFTGFRTLVKGSREGVDFISQPFFPSAQPIERNMMIGLNEMEIEEKDTTNFLQTNVLYFTAPNQNFPSLVRKTTFTNSHPTSDLQIEVLDGLAKLIPNGLGNYNIDAMGRTMEAWMNVYNVGNAQTDGDSVTQPFFHISQDTADQAQVRLIKDGYFSLAYLDGEGQSAAHPLLPFIVDPSVVFGQETSLTNADNFFAADASAQGLARGPQGTTSRTPCAFAASPRLSLRAGESITITSVYGYAESLETYLASYLPQVVQPTYAADKRTQARDLVEDMSERVATKTSSAIFDAYIKQDFIDNVLRGGLPIPLGSNGSDSPIEGANRAQKVFHVYSRIHGDLERDYNYFQIDVTTFSQGPGNFRDVSQNRRVDVFHSPFVKDFNIRMFLTFVQADAYNPLTVASTLFKVPTERLESLLDSLSILEPLAGEGSRNFVRAVLGRPFRPGQFFRDLAIANIQFGLSREDVINRIVAVSTQEFAGQFNQNGYWADHWTYTLDLLDSYLAIFPDAEESFLYEPDSIAFFMSPAFVRARINRYTLVQDPSKPGGSLVRSYSAVAMPGDADYSRERNDAINAINSDPNLLADSGAGNFYQRARDYSVFRVSPLAKLLLLGVLKFSTLDPMGMGVEMEGGKPGWNDAMNGLPGILGSGMPETYEMLRIIRYVRGVFARYGRPVNVAVEFRDFLTALDSALNVYLASDKSVSAEFNFWDASNGAREAYRQSVIATFQGTKASISADYLVQLLDKIDQKVSVGIANALKTTASGLSPTYFYYDCSNFVMVPVDGSSGLKVVPKSFTQKTLPLFLEGPTRHLKIVSSLEERRKIFQAVKSSPLYDLALKMFTLCESLAAMGQDIGRMKAFSPGWLENQSVWLHMSYKFYLELLRGGLYEEFFEEIATGLVPFMDHRVYGRSPLEAASFVVSSAFPDKKMHGSSFAARLSGSTAEFLSMWAIMFAGQKPFSVEEDDKDLVLTLQPVLPTWLFDDDDQVSFTFLGSVNVTYHNPSRANSWETTVQRYTVTLVNGQTAVVEGSSLVGDLALKVRNHAVKSIVVELA